VVALRVLAPRLRLPYAILLVIGGLVLALGPAVSDVVLAPELVILLFLPPLLYAAAYDTSIGDVRANLRPILSLAVGLGAGDHRRSCRRGPRSPARAGLADCVRPVRDRFAAPMLWPQWLSFAAWASVHHAFEPSPGDLAVARQDVRLPTASGEAPES
jgi:hypothetical protein